MQAKEKVQQLFQQHPDITQSMLAQELRITEATLSYQLNHSKNFSLDLYNQIIEFFERKTGVPTNPKSECNFLNNRFLEFSSIHNQLLSVLAIDIRKCTEDGVVDQDEKERLKRTIDMAQAESILKFDELRKLVEQLV